VWWSIIIGQYDRCFVTIYINKNIILTGGAFIITETDFSVDAWGCLSDKGTMHPFLFFFDHEIELL